MIKKLSIVFTIFTLVSPVLSFAQDVLYKVERPDQEFIFLEDRVDENQEIVKREEKKQRRQAAQAQRKNIENLPFDIKASNTKFDPETRTFKADGNVILTHSSSVIEADEVSVGVDTKEAQLKGDIRIEELGADISAKEANFNLDTGTGDLVDSKIDFTEGDYRLFANKISRIGRDEYNLDEAALTTCHCPEGDSCIPWYLNADRAHIFKNSYGEAWNTTLKVRGVPIFYSPYLWFPVARTRQTGLLPASFGNSSRTGFKLELPYFWAIDESSDLLLKPIVHSKVREGIDSEYRQIFSRDHTTRFGLTYFDESRRNENELGEKDLLGTDISGLDLDYDKLEDTRVAGFLDHRLRADLFDRVPIQVILDGRYLSDDLLLREFKNDSIGDQSSRFATSRGVVRAPIGESYSFDLSAEYNQALVDDDDFVFQRLPEAELTGLHSFKPFGESNPYGLKLALTNSASAVKFDRTKSVTGSRTELNEKLKLPFHYQNIFEGNTTFGMRASAYELDNTELVREVFDENGERMDEIFGELPSSSDRLIPSVGSKVGTVFERVYEVPEDSAFKRIAELGPLGRREKLVRLKHTLEPRVKHLFVPSIDQLDNPQFDSNDRLARKNIVTYELMQRLFGRYQPRDSSRYGLEETTPELSDLKGLTNSAGLDPNYDFGLSGVGSSESYQRLSRGTVHEFAQLKLYQSVDVDQIRDSQPGVRELSDLGVGLNLIPNYHVRFNGGANYSTDDLEFTSYTAGTQLLDKRGDELRTRLHFVDGNVRQLESSIQFLLNEELKLGYYTRYDDLKKEFIENKVGLRVTGNCNCWVLDFEFLDRLNPDETAFTVNLTFLGIGSFGDSFFARDIQEG